jgi:RNA polymerase sigma-70 factor (ECF subfamily)
METVDKRRLEPLLRRALAGDACAWNDFFGAVRKYLHAEVCKVLGPDTQGSLEHSAVVQSTLRRAWEHIGELFPDGAGEGGLGRFMAWITAIVRNRSHDEWRRVVRERAIAIGSAIEDLPARPASDRAGRRDRIAVELAAALARLPDRKRKAIEFFWFEGLSDDEISQRLGCSPGTVRVLRLRALRSLRSPELRSLLEECHDD